MHGVGDTAPASDLLLAMDARGKGVTLALGRDLGGLAQDQARAGPLTRANALTAAAFALFHLARHPVGWAAATCVPALVFGYFYERHGRTLAAPIGLHAGYNAVWLVLLGPG